MRGACCEVGYAGCRTHSPVPLSILGKAGGCAGSHMLHSETSVANPETLAMCLNTWEGWWPCWVPHAVLHSPQSLLPLLLGLPPQRYHAPLHWWAEKSSLCVQGSERVPESGRTTACSLSCNACLLSNIIRHCREHTSWVLFRVQKQGSRRWGEQTS